MAQFSSVEEIVAAVDEKTGNSLYGDLWRLALEAKECLRTVTFTHGCAIEAERRLDASIKRIEERWLKE